MTAVLIQHSVLVLNDSVVGGMALVAAHLNPPPTIDPILVSSSGLAREGSTPGTTFARFPSAVRFLNAFLLSMDFAFSVSWEDASMKLCWFKVSLCWK